jgi:hypothetical protein
VQRPRRKGLVVFWGPSLVRHVVHFREPLLRTRVNRSSLSSLVACYPVLRMESPEHSPWRAPRDDLSDSSYQGTVLDFSIFQPYEVALVGEPGEADTETLITSSTPPTCPTRWSPVTPQTTRRTRGSYPFWRIAQRAMAGRPPTSVRATPARTRRPTQRGWRGSSAFRRDRQLGGRPSILPGACTP